MPYAPISNEKSETILQIKELNKVGIILDLYRSTVHVHVCVGVCHLCMNVRASAVRVCTTLVTVNKQTV